MSPHVGRKLRALLWPCLALPVLLVSGCWFVAANPRLYRFEATVVDAASGQPLAGARVLVSLTQPTGAPEEDAAYVTTDGDGHFVLERAAGSFAAFGLLGITPDGDLLAPPPIETAYVVIEIDGWRTPFQVPVSEDQQDNVTDEVRAVDLGTILLALP